MAEAADPSLDLIRYDTIVLNTHNEFWSGEVFDHFSAAAKEPGAWVLCPRGNTLYRVIEITGDNSIRYVGREFVDIYEDETRVMGARLSIFDFGTWAPFPMTDPAHWLASGCEVKKGDPFGEEGPCPRTPCSPA